MVDLILWLKTTENGDCILHARLLGIYRLEPSLKGLVRLDVFPVFVQSSGTDGMELTSSESWLDEVGGICASFRSSCSYYGVKFINEEYDLSFALGDLVDHSLEPFLKLSPELCSCNEGTHIQRKKSLVLQGLRNVSLGDSLCQAFYNGCLSYSRFTDENRIVLCPSGKDLHDPSDLLIPSDDRIQLIFHGGSGKILAILVQSCILGFRVLACDPLVSSYGLQGFKDSSLVNTKSCQGILFLAFI